ncbi:NrtR DNA-binding winged helix domain-containing protein [Dyadobacter sp. LHD-138]|uniref:NUDIX hydrolase n=1 Tax=Dyadobacter sp. LHD-138 TaxID=3071413 RepID=UPI0027E165B1|nr:NUDIX domain-containing protein [Dyadobacter sp. LHD-138]MDQ6476914.1 NUDIX domain-containing protein [Dyadobacter sp. LHD-138]
MLHQYQTQTKCLVALDSIIFGFDGQELKLLLVKRGIEDEHHTWSLMGGWVQPDESLEEASTRILFELTNLSDIYLEQLHTFGNPRRDPVERTVSVAYFALINVDDYDNKISKNFEAQWFSMQELPQLLFDHSAMVQMAIEHLRYKASQHPIGFELLPEKFTIPQLQKLYEAIFGTELDKRNFSRKLLSTNLLIKLEEKQKGFSKKGAFYYKIDEEKYKKQFNTFLNFLPNGNA